MSTGVIALGIMTSWSAGAQVPDVPVQPGIAYVFFNQAIRDGKANAMRGEPLVMQAPVGDEADCSSIYRSPQPPARDGQPIQLGPGPQLFLDEYLIDGKGGGTFSPAGWASWAKACSAEVGRVIIVTHSSHSWASW
jgi:hypothetical protein